MQAYGMFAFLGMGLTLGLIGGGGSILTVPILVYLLGMSALPATAYSLLIVGVTALVGAGIALKNREVDLRTGALFALPSFVGVYATRAWVVPAIPDPVLTLGGYALQKGTLILAVFSVLMILASVTMIRPTSVASSPSKPMRYRWVWVAAEGLGVGAITGFVGAGGGFLIIPALVLLTGLPMKIAVGTSLAIIAAKSLLGLMGDLQSGLTLDWGLLLPALGLSLVGLAVGVRLRARFSDKSLKRGFGVFVLILGSAMLAQQVFALRTP